MVYFFAILILFHQVGLSDKESLLSAVLRQAYLGLREELPEATLSK